MHAPGFGTTVLEAGLATFVEKISSRIFVFSVAGGVAAPEPLAAVLEWVLP